MKCLITYATPIILYPTSHIEISAIAIIIIIIVVVDDVVAKTYAIVFE
jgi:hypothetical protein